MAKVAPETKRKFSLKRYLLTGLLVWLPIVVTLWVISYIINLSDGLVAMLPAQWQPKVLVGHDVPGFGLIIAVLVLFFTGVFGGNVIGRKIIQAWDGMMGRIPIVKSIYSSTKKVSESLLSDSRQSFKTPLLVNFPHPGVWSVAFVSGNVPEVLLDSLPLLAEDDEYLNVYVPTTPNPTGGYYITVKKSDTRTLDMSVDDALKYIISLGMVGPDGHENNEQQETLPLQQHGSH